jgi:hypothetical protein
MFEISRNDQERLLRMAAVAVANLAVDAILSTEPFKSNLRPTLELPPALPPSKPRKRRTHRKKIAK